MDDISRNEKLEKLRQKREDEKKKKEYEIENALDSLKNLDLYLDKELVIPNIIEEPKNKKTNKISDLINKFNKFNKD